MSFRDSLLAHGIEPADVLTLRQLWERNKPLSGLAEALLNESRFAISHSGEAMNLSAAPSREWIDRMAESLYSLREKTGLSLSEIETSLIRSQKDAQRPLEAMRLMGEADAKLGCVDYPADSPQKEPMAPLLHALYRAYGSMEGSPYDQGAVGLMERHYYQGVAEGEHRRLGAVVANKGADGTDARGELLTAIREVQESGLATSELARHPAGETLLQALAAFQASEETARSTAAEAAERVRRLLRPDSPASPRLADRVRAELEREDERPQGPRRGR